MTDGAEGVIGEALLAERSAPIRPFWYLLDREVEEHAL